jgi:hypothetical protein
MKITLSLLILLFGFNLFSQHPSKTQIIQSHDYYYGTGTHSDENRAREEAVRELSEMISVTIASQFEFIGTETNLQYKEFASSVIKTYATATLKNVEQLHSITPNGQVEILCYMSKARVQKLYQERAGMAYRMYTNGIQNRERGNLAFALKNFYFANLLIKSIPEERITVNNTEISLEIPRAINQILRNIKFDLTCDKMKSTRERRLSFDVTFENKPVSLLHFRFWDGHQIAGNGQVRDGQTTIRLAGNSVDFDELKIFVEYEYYNARREYQAVEDLWEVVTPPAFRNQHIIDLTNTGVANEPKPAAVNIPASTNLILKMDQGTGVEEQMLLNANAFLTILENGITSEAETLYGNDYFLYSKIVAYILHNHPIPATGDIEAEVNKTRLGYEIRKLEVNHNYPSLHKQATEYLVLDFDTTGTLIDFNLCITDDLYEKFTLQAGYGNDWGNRQEIIKFIEKYRTAFLTRDMETINLMFADEALILVGRKIKLRDNPGGEVAYQQLPGQPGYEQIKLTKEEYLTRQKRIFDDQKDIFIDFSTFEIVKKNNAEGVYGVEMRQNYSSTTYADEGYLFLLIDFNNADPLIYIRAWQPNEWDSTALVNTSNFRIYK